MGINLNYYSQTLTHYAATYIYINIYINTLCFENIELFDTSNFETTHPFYSLQNHRVLGKFKVRQGRLHRLNLWVSGQECIVSMYQTLKLKFGQKA